MNPTIDRMLLQAVEAHKSGKLQDAERLYRSILEVQPGHPDANHNLGVLAAGIGKHKEALLHLKVALGANPGRQQFWISYIHALIEAGQWPEANKILEEGKRAGLSGEPVKRLEQRLAGLPRSREPSQQEINELIACYNSGKFGEAERVAGILTGRFPNHPFGWKVLGAVFKSTGRIGDSLEPMRQSVRLNPDDAEAHSNLGVTLKDLGYLAEAEASYREAIRLRPDFAQAHSNLGNALLDLGRPAEAEASYREAIRLRPDFAEAHGNLGNALVDLGRLTEAEAGYREAIRLKPDFAQAYSNLGSTLKEIGRLAEAEASYREAIRLKPDFAEAHSNLLFSLNYVESLSPEEALAEAGRYGSMVSARAAPKFTRWHVDSEPTRLRIGFVSGDLRNHPVGYFVEGLIQHLDQDRFELHAFPTTPKTDDLASRIKPHFHGWTPLYAKNDFAAATAIHQQGIHVLIDLSGHTAHNRLPVFAYKPAPVQVTWLGYFATTGLPEMDYFLGDPCMSPKSEERHFTEKIWNLAETWLCLTPPAQPVPVASLPFLTNGHVTFGCFGNLSKMNDEVISLWAGLLQRVPGAKLFLKSRQFSDAGVIVRVQNRFAGRGISGDRLILEGPSSRTAYFDAYNRVDIVLDTFPYPGGTTSVDALWMGVPVLTMTGDRFLSHLGESIALNAGQPDWIAKDPDDYVNKAVAFASDRQGLAKKRTTLRNQVLQTPLFDARRFAGNFGEALRGMWREGSKNRQMTGNRR